VEGFWGKQGSTGFDVSQPPTFGDDGSMSFSVTMSALNGHSNVPLPGLDQTIDMQLGFSVSPDGSVTLLGGVRDGYPSVGIYSYDPSGDVIYIKKLYEGPEREFSDLRPPMEVAIPYAN
jgi:hypothetical protein